MKRQSEMYQAISENFDRQKKRTHEYKNQIDCMEQLLNRKQYSKLEDYVKVVHSKLDKELDAIDTNNIIVNAILNTKYQEADRNGIVVVLRVNDLSGMWIKDEDIVTILSNLLDNAIEACKKCDNGKRILKLIMSFIFRSLFLPDKKHLINRTDYIGCFFAVFCCRVSAFCKEYCFILFFLYTG